MRTAVGRVLCALVVFALSNIAEAQTVQGVVTGTVVDSSGANVPGAEITLTNEGTGVQQKETTKNDGAYRFSLVPPGVYTLAGKAQGFTERDVKGIIVEASKVVPVNVTVSVATAQATIEVTEQETMVQTATADLTTSINQRTIESMPLLSRNVFDLAFAAPAVTQGMNFNPSAGGARESGTGYMLNGAEDNDNFSEGGVNMQPPLESVHEFTLLTNNMNAQYGRAAGAVVSASQKSGTNAFHGVAYEFNRNRSFNASDFFQNRQGSPNPKYIRNQYGGEIDGPVIKDKTFFAFAYDRLDLRQGAETDRQVPTAAEVSAMSLGAGPIGQSILQKL